MTDLSRPWLLALLPLLLAGGWWQWRRACVVLEQSLGRGDREGSNRVPPSGAGLLRLGGGLVLVLALTGPRTARPRPLPPGEGLALMIALDVSGSMMTRGEDGRTRLDVAREEIARFIRARPHDRVGLVTFGESAVTVVPSTGNHDHLLEVLGGLSVEDPDERTALGAGLGLAIHHVLSVPSPSQVVLLFTDGRGNTGTIDPLLAADAARAVGVRVHAVGLGDESGTEPLDADLLRKIAGTTGGHAFRAEDAEGLRRVLAALDRMETAPLAREAGVVHEPRHFTLLLVALLLLALEAGLRALPGGRI